MIPTIINIGASIILGAAIADLYADWKGRDTKVFSSVKWLGLAIALLGFVY